MALFAHERSRNGGLDEVPLPGLPGRLWLCGKHLVGPDPEALLERTGAAAIVCLNERYELDRRYPGYVAWLEANGRSDRAVWFPMPDLHVSPVAAVRPLLADLVRRVEAGEGIVVHCGAGMGRAGTVAAALLITLGEPLDGALARVTAARPGAGPQAAVQQELLAALAHTATDP